MQYIEFYLRTKMHIDPSIEYFVLIGSHDSLLNDYLSNLQIANTMYKNFHCRTVLGCAHDMFTVCPDLILKMIKWNASTPMIKVAFASDHGGYQLKKFLIDNIDKSKYEVIDCGCNDSTTSVDYPEYAKLGC